MTIINYSSSEFCARTKDWCFFLETGDARHTSQYTGRGDFYQSDKVRNRIAHLFLLLWVEQSESVEHVSEALHRNGMFGRYKKVGIALLLGDTREGGGGGALPAAASRCGWKGNRLQRGVGEAIVGRE